MVQKNLHPAKKKLPKFNYEEAIFKINFFLFFKIFFLWFLLFVLVYVTKPIVFFELKFKKIQYTLLKRNQLYKYTINKYVHTSYSAISTCTGIMARLT